MPANLKGAGHAAGRSGDAKQEAAADHAPRLDVRLASRGAAPRVAARPLFFALNAQQVARVRPGDVFGAAAMLLGVVSWGVLAALLGS